jgi:hypothetical protein
MFLWNVLCVAYKLVSSLLRKFHRDVKNKAMVITKFKLGHKKIRLGRIKISNSWIAVAISRPLTIYCFCHFLANRSDRSTIRPLATSSKNTSHQSVSWCVIGMITRLHVWFEWNDLPNSYVTANFNLGIRIVILIMLARTWLPVTQQCRIPNIAYQIGCCAIEVMKICTMSVSPYACPSFSIASFQATSAVVTYHTAKDAKKCSLCHCEDPPIVAITSTQKYQ